jgi:hypothetical protein
MCTELRSSTFNWAPSTANFLTVHTAVLARTPRILSLSL